ncbi:MAG: 50S ribosomal protein L25/general stress protein Ctc [Chlamydiota bacterium]
MKLTVTKRDGTRKSEVKQIRRKGNIPAILYAAGRSCENIEVDGNAFKTILREIKAGRLSTTQFLLECGSKERLAVVKDIQYHPTTYQIIHLDFEELLDNSPVSLNVPITCTGIVECMGIKLGGFLRQVIRQVKVECLPKDIPSEFVIDVRDLGIRQSKRLRDLVLPQGVKPMAPMEEVVVVIAKR